MLRFARAVGIGISLFFATTAAAAFAAEPPVVLVGFFGVTDPRYKELGVPDRLLPDPERYIYFALPVAHHMPGAAAADRLLKLDLSFFAGPRAGPGEGMRDPFLEPDASVFRMVERAVDRRKGEWYRIEAGAWEAAGLGRKPVYMVRHGKRWKPEFKYAVLQRWGRGLFQAFLVVDAEACGAVPEDRERGARYLASDRGDLHEIPLESKAVIGDADGCFEMSDDLIRKHSANPCRLNKKVKQECLLDPETRLEICRAAYKCRYEAESPTHYTRLIIRRGGSVLYDTLKTDEAIAESRLDVEVYRAGGYSVTVTHNGAAGGDYFNVIILDEKGSLWERGLEFPSGC
jgi:hypothetical protein